MRGEPGGVGSLHGIDQEQWDRIPVPALIADGTGRILAANEAAASRWQTSAAHLQELGIAELAGDTAEGRPAPDMVHIPLREGAVLVLAPDHGPDGAVSQGVRHLARLATLGRLVSSVVHEINNALSGIAGYSQLLLAQPLPEAALRDLQRVQGEAQRAAQVAQRLLRFSRDKVGTVGPVCLPEVLTSCAQIKRRDLARRSIELDLQLPSGLPDIEAEEALLIQVFLNLITNAEHSIAEVRDHGRIRIRARRSGDAVTVRVQDDGPGIPKELRRRIFQPFFTTRPPGEGSGLGLAICRDSLAEMDAAIELVSSREPGACFRLRFPLSAGSTQAADSGGPGRAPPGGLRRRRIIVVEDEPSQREILTRAFSGNGNRLVVFERGEDALEYLLHDSVDLVVSDLHRPGLSGEELFLQVRRQRPALARRFLFLTGDTASPETRRFRADSGAPVLSKPIVLDDLLRAAHKVLREPEVADLFRRRTGERQGGARGASGSRSD